MDPACRGPRSRIVAEPAADFRQFVAGAVSQRRHRAARPRDSDRDRIGRRATRARDHGRRSDRRLLARGVDPAAPQIAGGAHRARRFWHRLLVDVVSAGVSVRHDQDRPQLHIEPRTQRAIEGPVAWRYRTGPRARATGDRRGRRDASPARRPHPCRLRSRAGLPDRKAGADRRLCGGRGPIGQPGAARPGGEPGARREMNVVNINRKSQRGDGLMRFKLILTATALCVASHAAIAQELTGTLEKIRSTGVITIGHSESSIPFSYYDKNEKVVGYAMDLCYVVADAVKAKLGLAKLEVKLVPITPSLRVPFILSDKIDLGCETMTNNLERQKVVAFSPTYFIAANRFVSKVAANLRTLDDLKGRTVVSTIGSTNLKQIVELNEQRHLGLTILAAKDNFEAFRMLESDRAAAVVMDDILLYGL